MENLKSLFIKCVLEEVSKETSEEMDIDNFRDEIETVLNLAQAKGDEELVKQMENLISMNESFLEEYRGVILTLLVSFILSVLAPKFGIEMIKKYINYNRPEIHRIEKEIAKAPKEKREKRLRGEGGLLAQKIAGQIRLSQR